MAIVEAMGDYPRHLGGNETEGRLLLAASQFAIFYLAVFPLVSYGLERWGRTWAWLYLVASFAVLLLGGSAAHWAIKAWLG